MFFILECLNLSPYIVLIQNVYSMAMSQCMSFTNFFEILSHNICYEPFKGEMILPLRPQQLRGSDQLYSK
ncbi:hypothetical protein B33_21070 [Bacillus safensis]|nr:hypothetical protein B33_21070 [Bacillus safensis]